MIEHIGRTGCLFFSYSFEKAPVTIPIKKPIKPGYDDESLWSKFKGIRFLDDIKLEDGNDKGDVRLRYSDRTYNCPSGSRIILPNIEKIVPSSEFIFDNPRGLDAKNLKEQTKGRKWGNIKHGINRNISLGEDLYPNKKAIDFYIRTKVEVINYGFLYLE